MTWCPYDETLLGITLDDRERPTEFGGDCMHAQFANHFLKNGEDLQVAMPCLAAHLVAVIARGQSPRGQACADAGPPFHYPDATQED